jgi:hypothetical protein
MNRQAGGRLLAGLLGSVAGSGVFQAMRADDRLLRFISPMNRTVSG